MIFPIGLLVFADGTAKAKQSEENQSKIKGNSVKVPPVGQGPDQGHSVHGPIKAELVGAQQQPGIGSR